MNRLESENITNWENTFANDMQVLLEVNTIRRQPFMFNQR